MIDFSSSNVEELLEKYKNIQTDTIFNFNEMFKTYPDHAKFVSQHYVKTGFKTLDKMIYSIQAGEVVTIVAKTNAGKTAFLLNLIRNNLNEKTIIPYFSLENTEFQLLERIVQLETGTQFYETQKKFLKNDTDFIETVKKISDKWTKGGLISIVKRVPLDLIVPYIRVCEELSKKRASFVCIDYIGLVRSSKPGDYERMTEIAQGIKEFALKTKIPFICVSQTARINSKDKLSGMSTAKGSGAIEESSQMLYNLDTVEGVPAEMYEDKGLVKLVEDKKVTLLVLTPEKLKRKDWHPIYIIMDKNSLKMYEYNTESINQINQIYEELPF